MFTKDRSLVMDSDSGVTVLSGMRKGNISFVDFYSHSSEVCFFHSSISICELWHRRLAHLNVQYLSKLAKKNLVRGLPSARYVKEKPCRACQLGKVSFQSKSHDSSSKILHLLHMDLFGPISVSSLGGKSYSLVIVDDYSR